MGLELVALDLENEISKLCFKLNKSSKEPSPALENLENVKLIQSSLKDAVEVFDNLLQYDNNDNGLVALKLQEHSAIELLNEIAKPLRIQVH